MMKKNKPTKEQMLIFEKIRLSGLTNMLDAKAVSYLSNGLLIPDICRYILSEKITIN